MDTKFTMQNDASLDSTLVFENALCVCNHVKDLMDSEHMGVMFGLMVTPPLSLTYNLS